MSGCVSTDASLTSQLAPTTVGLEPLDDTLVPQETASLGYNGSIPVPDNTTALASSYNSVPDQTVAAAAAPQTITTVPASINALDRNGQIYAAQTPNTAVANPQVASLATATPASTSLARPNKDGNAFFSSLFKRQAKPTPARTVATAPAPQPSAQQVAAPVATPEVKKPQITRAKKVTLASATPVASERVTAGKEKKRGIFSSIFGSKDKNKSKDKNRVQVASAAGLARLSPLTLQRQTERVDVACFKPELVRLLKKVEKHYGKPVVVTSGYRSPKHNKRIGGANGSRHTTCEAADVQIKGVTKWELAKFVRTMPDRGGVGTYCHTQSVHIDIGSVRDWNWRCRKRKR
ncbi:MAG: D-Ala-D-Ala carboxypeptidase family metallohydrolase [Lentilitoribacter sp.]